MIIKNKNLKTGKMDIKKVCNKRYKLYVFERDSAATRTQNLLLRRQLLYPVELRNLLVGIARFELATSCSQSRRDNRTTLYPVFDVAKVQQFSI